MLRTPTILIALIAFSAACTTTAGFEDARAVPAGETKTTIGGVASLHTAPRTAHELRPGADDDDPDTWGALPMTFWEPEFIVRRTKGLPAGREAEITMHTLILSPWTLGLGAGVGAKNQFTADRDGPIEVATGLRASGHVSRVGSGGNTLDIGHLQLEGRLIGSLHGDRWALSVAPKVATVYTRVHRYHVEYGSASMADSTFLGGATLGVTFDQITQRRLLGEERQGMRRHFVEVGWLVGSPFSHPSVEWSAPVFDTSRHMQLSVGYGLRR